MAFQQNLQETTVQFDDVSQTKDAKPVSASDNSTGFCDCNICLDSARDPVVTLCGHLYCWPCIYKWLHVQTSSQESDKQPNCPVCKAHISNSSLVPLYGRGNSPLSESESEPKRPHQSDLVIPSRPPAPSGSIVPLNQQMHPGPFQPPPPPPAVNHPQPFGSYATLGGPITPTGFSNPFVGMVGEMVCAMIFRSPDSGLFAAYPYGPYQYQNPYPYPVAGAANGSPRVRRQALQVEKSLNRLTIFFFCCFILCLLLF